MNIYYKKHRIKTWLVQPIGYTFKIQRNGTDIYVGSGEAEIYRSEGDAVIDAKYIIDHKLKGLRICKIGKDDNILMVRTDADNHELNTLLGKFKSKLDYWDNDEIVDYLNDNLTTGKVENIMKKEEK